MKASVEMDSKKVKFPNQPVQWHLASTIHDVCPRCSARLAFLGRARRACLSNGPNDETLNNSPEAYFIKYNACPPGTVWETRYTAEGFLDEMVRRGEEAVPLRPRKSYTRKETNK